MSTDCCTKPVMSGGSSNPTTQRPTMRDVAAAAGVSLKTVSRVVNREAGVRPELTERVRRAVEELGYNRDERASNLRSAAQTTRTIGFIYVDVANPFFSSIFRGLEDVARERGFVVLAGSCHGDPNREAELISTFVSRRVDGLIVVPSPAAVEQLSAEVERGTTVVSVDLRPEGLMTDVVLTDHRVGSRLATQHLIDHGHHRIAFLGDDDEVYFSALQRKLGYLDALESAGIAVDDSLISLGFGLVGDEERGDDATALAVQKLRELLDIPNPPTAVFTAQRFVTMNAVRALHHLGLQHTIAQVGFDDIDLADTVEPGITVVPQDPRRLGQLAGERLFARLDGDTSPPEVETLPPVIIERGSGEIRPST